MSAQSTRKNILTSLSVSIATSLVVSILVCGLALIFLLTQVTQLLNKTIDLVTQQEHVTLVSTQKVEVPVSTSTPRETNIVPHSQTDDRVSYACSGETQICEKDYVQTCIYVGCQCDDGFKPVGEVDGCRNKTIKEPNYKTEDWSMSLTEKGDQYAFAGECAQICRQVGH